MNKSKLRQKTIHFLQSISEKERKEIEHKLTENLLSQDLWNEATMIGTTISQNNEWDTQAIIQAAWEQGKNVCVPKCYPSEKKLTFFQFESYNQLEVVYYNLQEPNPEETIVVEKENIDLLIVPGLLFDQDGYRIGFGGGYYDRFLTNFPNKTISLFSNKQLVDYLPIEQYDIPIEHLITEHGKVRG